MVVVRGGNKLKSFLKTYFGNLQIVSPLFYNWQYGLRFELGVKKATHNGYFEEAIRRASLLFESAFDASDDLLILLNQYKFKRQKIRHTNYLFKQIESLDKRDIHYQKQILINPPEKLIINTAIVQTTANKVNYKNIITAISRHDFPTIQPRISNGGSLLGDVYFINLNKKIIFHMYDDRGLDIIATDKETLAPLYKKYNDWILNYDRNKIDTLFKV